MLSATQITWNQAHYLWNDFKLGDLYAQYLLETYGINVNTTIRYVEEGYVDDEYFEIINQTGGRVIWNHVLNVIEVVIEQLPGGAYYPVPTQTTGKKKKARKKIKLIFIMGDYRKELTKEKLDIISPKITSDIQNKIEEQIKAKITLSDVQIIKG